MPPIRIRLFYMVHKQKNKKSYTMKLQKISQNITPFAEISFVIEEFNKYGLSELIDKQMGIRSMSGYQYSDIILGWFSVFFFGCAIFQKTSGVGKRR